MSEPLVAWRVSVMDMTAIVFAATVAKARWIAVSEYWEAGFGRKGLWPSTSVGRAPRFDNHPLIAAGPKCWTESHIEDTRA